MEKLLQVLTAYDLGELKNAWRAKGGFVNDNWILETTRGRYFLKRRHPDLRNLNVICAQHALINYLKRSGFQAPDFISARDGKTLLVLEGEFFEIQEHIQGSVYEQSNPAHFQSAAVTLRRYHACVRGFRSQALTNLGDLYSPAALMTNLSKLRETCQLDRIPTLIKIVRLLDSHAAELAHRFSQHRDFPRLVIHGDYHAGNMLFEGDKVTGVVDYDKARWQPRVVELAEALIYFTSSLSGQLKHLTYRGFLDWDKFTTFLGWYAHAIVSEDVEGMRRSALTGLAPGSDRRVSFEETQLNKNEIEALPDYIRCIWLTVSLQHLLERGIDLAEILEALGEVLALGDWAATNAQRMLEAIRGITGASRN